MANVNLDALIPREDFLAPEGYTTGVGGKTSIGSTDLLQSEFFHATLRKPDFQRETASWTSDAIRDFVKAFIDGELIPSVICWQSPSRLSFVIDGAHRLSAIIAWQSDDYGDGEQSRRYYGNQIPDAQIRVAKKTRELINRDIGSYLAIKAERAALGANPGLTTMARALGHSSIPLLWVNSSDPKKAERAFFTINQSAAQIDPSELKILGSRFTPTAIVARVIVRNATGHKYWKDFSPSGQTEIEALGQRVFAALYNPPLENQIKTTELPVAGHGYGSQTLPLIFDLINIANLMAVVDPSKRKVKAPVTEREVPSETETLNRLKKTEQLVRRMSGNHAASLGLHPAVYFYSASGRHQPTAVLATAQLVMDLEEKNKLKEFTDIRARFEEFLVTHKHQVNQLTAQYGSMAKGYRQLNEYYHFILERFAVGESESYIEEALSKNAKFKNLAKQYDGAVTQQSKEFSRLAKQTAFLSEAMERALTCKICGARVDAKSMQFDHAQEVREGGLGDPANAQIAHGYCNSTYKSIKDRPAR